MKHKEGRTVIDDVARSSAFATPSIAYVRRRPPRVGARQALRQGCAEKGEHEGFPLVRNLRILPSSVVAWRSHMTGYIELCYRCDN
jgi:hypothetical protein